MSPEPRTAGGDPVAWPASHIPVLSPVFRVAFVKFGGLLALVVLYVSSNVYPGCVGRLGIPGG
ncbi:MAG: hypothetical protein NHB14_08945 [Desulfosporosinus sp.]|nr:hypothetical protein [Desulfosporosinus sp.]